MADVGGWGLGRGSLCRGAAAHIADETHRSDGRSALQVFRTGSQLHANEAFRAMPAATWVLGVGVEEVVVVKVGSGGGDGFGGGGEDAVGLVEVGDDV